MPAWQVLILSGPAGTGKSSVACALFQAYTRPVHLQLTPLREVREAMAERLGAVTIGLDTSRETVDQTVSRILDLTV